MEPNFTKKSRPDLFFLAVIIFHIVLEILLYKTPLLEVLPWNIAVNMIISQSVIWIPGLIYFVITRTNPISFCRFKRVRLGTIFMTILFTMLCSPLTTLANAISMIFVDNTVLAISGNVVDMPFVLMFILMALYGPLVEETAYRGIVYQGYREKGNVFKAILISAFLFAIMHMNINQAAYAFVIGIMLALLAEATGSIWPSFIMHMCINSSTVVSMFAINTLSEGMMETAVSAAEAYTTEELLLVISVYMVLAVVFTPLAFCALAWIAGHEKRKDALAVILPNRKSFHAKLFSLSLIVGIVLCFAMMIINQIQM